MEEPKIPIAPWLPWATTACLAALVACLAELWNVEKVRGQLLRDQGLMAEAALKGAENQLEAERIVDRRERERVAPAAQAALQVELLAPPDGAASRPGRAFGALLWESGSTRALLKVSGLGEGKPLGGYRLWVEGPAQAALAAGPTMAAEAMGQPGGLAVDLPFAATQGIQFYLVENQPGAATLAEARSRGSIVLASLPGSGKMPNP